MSNAKSATAFTLASAALAALALAACNSSPSATAGSASDARAAAWAEVGHWPEFQGGIWLPQRGPRAATEQPAYVPEVAARLAALGPISPESLGNSYCLPAGGPVDHMGEIFFSKDDIFIIKDEDYLNLRHIHLNQASHGDPDPSYLGHSIGHWEGDTLVIDTVGLLPEVTIAPKVPGNGDTHIVERLRLVDADTMEQIVTIDNPGVLVKPWTHTNRYQIRRDLHIQESFCAQNNRDYPVDGEASVDLTPPPAQY